MKSALVLVVFGFEVHNVETIVWLVPSRVWRGLRLWLGRLKNKLPPCLGIATSCCRIGWVRVSRTIIGSDIWPL